MGHEPDSRTFVFNVAESGAASQDWASGFPTMSSHPAHPSLLSVSRMRISDQVSLAAVEVVDVESGTVQPRSEASAAMNRSTRTASSLSWSTSRSWRRFG